MRMIAGAIAVAIAGIGCTGGGTTSGNASGNEQPGTSSTGGPQVTSFTLSPQCPTSGTVLTATWSSERADGCELAADAWDKPAVGVELSGTYRTSPVSAILVQGDIAVYCWKGAHVTKDQCYSSATNCTTGLPAFVRKCASSSCAYYERPVYNTDNFDGYFQADYERESGCTSTASAGGSDAGTGGGGGSSCSGKCSKCLDACHGIPGCCCGDGCICSSACTSVCNDKC